MHGEDFGLKKKKKAGVYLFIVHCSRAALGEGCWRAAERSRQRLLLHAPVAGAGVSGFPAGDFQRAGGSRSPGHFQSNNDEGKRLGHAPWCSNEAKPRCPPQLPPGSCALHHKKSAPGCAQHGEPGRCFAPKCIYHPSLLPPFWLQIHCCIKSVQSHTWHACAKPPALHLKRARVCKGPPAPSWGLREEAQEGKELGRPHSSR